MAHHPTPAASDLRRLAEQAARFGGEVALAAFGREHAVRLKHDHSEVTDIDVAAERAVVGLLRAARPGDGFITEEHPPAPSSSGVWWIVDPIDGTRNFIRGIPCFGCSVAAMVDGWPVAGAIYDPVAPAMYSVDRESGAWLDDAPLRLAAAPEPAAAGAKPKLLVAIPSARHARTHAIVLRWIDELVIRNFGAATTHLAMVAAGRLDAALLTNSRLWDIAAGWAIVKGAGGEMTTPEGAAHFPIDTAAYRDAEMPALAASRAAHAQLVPSRRG
ncbi:MAG: inositol monophosphatase [Phycisphaerae bacterium]|nr:inositol monophosphatase [Phycisphaerae bacterium]MCZ2401592.1 inositol monophosphatase [Phycisphaerae bacterium]